MTLSEVEKLKLAREAAEARIAELESWYAASQESQRELLKRIALADRLAKAVRWWVKFTDRESFFPDDGDQWEALDQEIREALAAYRSPETGSNQA
jgi:hypothetical protein